MDIQNLSTLSVAIYSIALGVFFGLLVSRQIVERDKSKWVFAFYILGSLPLLLIIYYIILSFSPEFVWSIDIIGHLVLLLISGVLILFFSAKNFAVKDVYETRDLDPIINDTTKLADKNEIKLFGGDLNFLGDSVNEMDLNQQYAVLKSQRFQKVLIICEKPNPNDVTAQIRYGKLLTEIPSTELRYYRPNEADLRVRGRIFQVSGVDHLLMFNKLGPKKYKAIRTNTANSNGALYSNIWTLIWSLAIRPKEASLEKYKNLYLGKR